ncbi:MAG TPA: Asp23/Gls24 family envelope stress response protein [Enterococcus columbae]|nr:Asp23/Gls24 family envelope stress response protein [Enterococcus columbae]
MADEKALKLDVQDDLGEIVIAPEVIEIISGITAAKVDGVHHMQGSFANNVTELLGRSVYDKGVYLSTTEEGIQVDAYVSVKYGVSVPKVATEIQQKIKQQVLYMTDVTLAEVNVHVVAVVPEKMEAMNLDELFDAEEDDNE